MHRVTRPAARIDGIFNKNGISVSFVRVSRRAKSNGSIHSPCHKTTYLIRVISGLEFYTDVTHPLEPKQAYVSSILSLGFTMRSEAQRFDQFY